jgi:LysR family glycine cleavage system transcriptional activator
MAPITAANNLAMAHLPSLFAMRALEAAARRGSYSAAARDLTVTQGAISQQIRRLEAQFGTRLFHRRGNDMVPTAAALRLAGEVRSAMARLQAAVDVFAAAAGEEPLVLSVDGRFGSRWLGPKLPRLLAHPAGANLDIRVEERVSNFTTDGVDVGIRCGRGDWPNLQAERLTTETFWVVCSPDFAARYPIAEPRDLLAVPLIHSSDGLWPALFERHGLPSPPPAGLVANDSLLVLEAVGQGLGAALVRNSMVEEDLRAGRLVRPFRDSVPVPRNFIRPGQLVRFIRDGEPTPPEIGYFLVWPADSRKAERIIALRDWLAAEARMLAGEPPQLELA